MNNKLRRLSAGGSRAEWVARPWRGRERIKSTRNGSDARSSGLGRTAVVLSPVLRLGLAYYARVAGLRRAAVPLGGFPARAPIHNFLRWDYWGGV